MDLRMCESLRKVTFDVSSCSAGSYESFSFSPVDVDGPLADPFAPSEPISDLLRDLQVGGSFVCMDRDLSPAPHRLYTFPKLEDEEQSVLEFCWFIDQPQNHFTRFEQSKVRVATVPEGAFDRDYMDSLPATYERLWHSLGRPDAMVSDGSRIFLISQLQREEISGLEGIFRDQPLNPFALFVEQLPPECIGSSVLGRFGVLGVYMGRFVVNGRPRSLVVLTSSIVRELDKIQNVARFKLFLEEPRLSGLVDGHIDTLDLDGNLFNSLRFKEKGLLTRKLLALRLVSTDSVVPFFQEVFRECFLVPTTVLTPYMEVRGARNIEVVRVEDGRWEARVGGRSFGLPESGRLVGSPSYQPVSAIVDAVKSLFASQCDLCLDPVCFDQFLIDVEPTGGVVRVSTGGQKIDVAIVRGEDGGFFFEHVCFVGDRVQRQRIRTRGVQTFSELSQTWNSAFGTTIYPSLEWSMQGIHRLVLSDCRFKLAKYAQPVRAEPIESVISIVGSWIRGERVMTRVLNPLYSGAVGIIGSHEGVEDAIENDIFLLWALQNRPGVVREGGVRHIGFLSRRDDGELAFKEVDFTRLPSIKGSRPLEILRPLVADALASEGVPWSDIYLGRDALLSFVGHGGRDGSLAISNAKIHAEQIVRHLRPGPELREYNVVAFQLFSTYDIRTAAVYRRNASRFREHGLRVDFVTYTQSDLDMQREVDMELYVGRMTGCAVNPVSMALYPEAGQRMNVKLARVVCEPFSKDFPLR